MLRHLESEQASDSFVRCVRRGGGFQVMDRPWALIKEFMIMSDEHGLQLFRQASAKPGLGNRQKTIDPT